MSPLETYLQSLHDISISGAGVPETSGYGALANLFNEVGKSLKPRVRCIINIANKGAGIPDGGFFTPDQFQKRAKGQLIEGQLPSRGAIEVKPTRDDIDATAESDQVRRYLSRYQQVLVTNYRDFILVGLDANGNLVKRERFALAPNETEFWKAASHPRATGTELVDRFIEYLKRVMLHAAPLTQPKDVAWFLASYARDAKIRVESSELPALAAIRSALEEALGLKFEGEKGDHFFRSTLVQTLFYGIFSAWVLWSKKNQKRTDKFDWRNATWELHVPMIKALFEQVATPTKLEAADLVEVLDWTGDVLNRVDRQAFFANFEEGHAVQYFYEPFLEAFDPELRKELGVWFTPTEIVKYMVARVDTVLREELDIADGLADSRVYVLDPCCGTGAYLVEVLHKIHETAKAKGEDALAVDDLKCAAKERVFGFEILPAPFVVSHLQLGLLLQNLGAPLSELTNERVGVYLTNSLTGWEPPSEEVKARLKQLAFSFAELKEEHDAAERVKQKAPILVILGNPPYNAFAGVSPEEEAGLVDPYKAGLISEWGIKKFNLDDLYVRFFRLAERRIAQKKGIVSFISNFSYLRDPSFVVMRQRFLAEFDKLWFDSMNGDSRGTGKLTPEGKPDPSVFSTEYNREGIRVGTAIALMVRKEEREEMPTVRFRQFWGVTKRADLLTSASVKDLNMHYEIVAPTASNRLSFQYTGAIVDYLGWPSVSDLSGRPPFRAFIEARRGALIGIDKTVLQDRMKTYYDSEIDWETLKLTGNELTEDAARFNAKKAREKVITAEKFDANNLRRYGVRPLETRWCYHSSVRPLWNEPRPELIAQCWKGNQFLVTRLKTEKEAKGSPIYFSSTLVDYQTIARNVSTIPLGLSPTESEKISKQNHFFNEPERSSSAIVANLSSKARAYLASLGCDDPDRDKETATLIWIHALAIGYSPAYLNENADGIRGDWPRIPLPSTKDALVHSANLGRKIAALLDTESGVEGVTSGTINDPFRRIGSVSHVSEKPLNPAEDLKVTAGWGHAGKGGVTMPGKGKLIERDYSPEERKAIERGAEKAGLSIEEALAHLGERTCDVYLNDVAYWKNIPARVWDYTIGGYQVIKKWLSYRELELLGRPLTSEEAREVMNIARRIAAIVLLESALDANYQTIKNASYDWNALKGPS
ncbi:MAG TPA: type ISP restriction/modification enzyme [Pyrinomonadaceae bacterium]|jgi:hypothetical protein|nr:type ISP restriction/modification enzyme [Pyrinomonadaceae bacterium]